MKQLHLVSFLAAAAAIAACSALDRSVPTAPSAPSAPTAPTVTTPSTPAAPTAPAVAAPTVPAVAITPAAPAAAMPKSLKAAMEGIEEDWKLLEKAVAAPAGDLAPVAAAADRVAAVMKLAYDPWEDKEVPGFAKFAREAEAAFRDLAQKARAGDAAAIKELGKTLQPQHCARCHDAVEQVHG